MEASCEMAHFPCSSSHPRGCWARRPAHVHARRSHCATSAAVLCRTLRSLPCAFPAYARLDCAAAAARALRKVAEDAKRLKKAQQMQAHDEGMKRLAQLEDERSSEESEEDELQPNAPSPTVDEKITEKPKSKPKKKETHRGILRPPRTLETTMFDRLEKMYGPSIKRMLSVQYR